MLVNRPAKIIFSFIIIEIYFDWEVGFFGADMYLKKKNYFVMLWTNLQAHKRGMF